MPAKVIVAQTKPEFRAQSNVVLVPTIVRSREGQTVFGLSAKDFIIEDNGLEQTVTLDETPTGDTAPPVSFVLALQLGRSALFHFKKNQDSSLNDPFYTEAERKNCRLRKPACPITISGLGTMLDAVIEETHGEVAIVTFDSEVRLFQDFTNDVGPLSARLKALTPGDKGAAILDAVRYSLDLLARRSNRRHVLLLISEARDHGSRVETSNDVVQRLTLSNTIVYSLAFSSTRAEFLHRPTDQLGTTNLLNPIGMAFQGMHKNIAQSLAQLTGGEYLRFKDSRTFEASFSVADDDVRNDYLLKLPTEQPTPGLHTIRVRLRDGRSDVLLSARTAYWASTR